MAEKMDTISYKIEIPDPYQNAYERMTMELHHRLLTREMVGIEAALKEYGYVKVKTCKVSYEYVGTIFPHSILVKELSCGHEVRIPYSNGEELQVVNNCPECGAKVERIQRW